MAVAKLVVPEICDGACLQLGIGSMPNAIGKMIAESDLKDLGVHTEMYVDARGHVHSRSHHGLRKPLTGAGRPMPSRRAHRSCMTSSTTTLSAWLLLSAM